MKKYIVLLLVLFFLGGCASARYELSDSKGTKKEITYKVIGKREFHNLRINPKTGLIELGNSAGDSGELAKLINNILELAAKGAGVP